MDFYTTHCNKNEIIRCENQYASLSCKLLGIYLSQDDQDQICNSKIDNLGYFDGTKLGIIRITTGLYFNLPLKFIATNKKAKMTTVSQSQFVTKFMIYIINKGREKYF